MILTLKCSIPVEECPQCKGVWLDNCRFGEFQKNEYSKLRFSKHIESKYLEDQDRPHYYRKDFVENDTLDNLFDFEYE